jgi:hypothetical protein
MDVVVARRIGKEEALVYRFLERLGLPYPGMDLADRGRMPRPR